MNDDTETELLALGGRVRAIEDRLSGLDGPIANIQAKLDTLLDAASEAPTNFHWGDLSPEDAQDRWDGLLEWTQNVLCTRYPAAVKTLKACWWQHPDVVDALTAAWLVWSAAYRSPKAEATDAGNWHRIYLPALLEQTRASLSCCDRGHEPDTPPDEVMATAPRTI